MKLTVFSYIIQLLLTVCNENKINLVSYWFDSRLCLKYCNIVIYIKLKKNQRTKVDLLQLNDFVSDLKLLLFVYKVI